MSEKVDELVRSEQRFQTLVRLTSQTIWTNNPEGRMQGAQPGWAAFTGQSYNDYQGFGWSAAVHPADAQPTIDEWNRCVVDRRPFVFEHRVRRHDGVYRICTINAAPVLNDDGSIREWVGVHNDITERRQQEHEIHAQESKFRFLTESLPQILWTAKPDGGLDYFNRRWFTYTGMTLEQTHGWGWGSVLHPDDLQNAVRLWGRSVETGEPLETESRFRRGSDGTYRWHLHRAVPLRDAQGAIVTWFGTSTDIHDYKEAEAKNLALRAALEKRVEQSLRRAHERFALAADAAGIGVWEWDLSSNALHWDDQMYWLYGRKRAAGEEPYALWATSLHAEDRARTEREINQALRDNTKFDSEFRIVLPSGEIRHLKAMAQVQTDGARPTVRMIGVNFDITARKQAELDLKHTSSLLRLVLDSASGLSIIATDPSLNINVFNAGAERLLGYTSEEIVGRTTPLLIHDADEVRVVGQELSTQVGRPIEGAAIFHEPSVHGRSREWSYLRKDGARVPVALVVTRMQTDDGELLGYLGVAQDVTAQKQYEESLRLATQEAERANRAKSLFLANMSHEIRTPMNAVIGLTHLLEQTSLNPEQSGLLANINIASKALLSVITDVLDISKIEAGELMISRVAFNPRVLLDGLHAIMRPQVDLKGITLQLDVPDDLPTAMQGDAVRLNQILTNLLCNAIKFTERGGVVLCVRVLASAATGSTLSFTVRDTGIGIDPAAQARLFAPFIQADESITRRYGGTGLGLSIIRSLANLMGGTVDFSSTVGVGSEFRVVLEFACATEESLAAAQPRALSRGERPLSGVRVLVVDDYDMNQVVTRRILEQEGALVWVADNGQVAVENLQRQPNHFDVVLMDVQMPIMDGYEATRRIRADLGLRDLPIIALTAGALLSERQRATEVGMDDFIIKPFDPAALISSVMHHTVSTVRTVGALVPAVQIHAVPQTADGWVAWADIAGIDIQDARNRFCDDPALFRCSLQRFLGDFPDSAVPSSLSGPADLAEPARRLHKLKGGAGTLGAKAIQHLAAETEAACVAGDGARARERSIELAAHLQALHSSADQVFKRADR